jgi:hypothetical protein
MVANLFFHRKLPFSVGVGFLPSGIYYKRNDFQTEIKYKKEPSEVEEKVTSFSTETDSEKYGKVGSNNKRSPHNTSIIYFFTELIIIFLDSLSLDAVEFECFVT